MSNPQVPFVSFSISRPARWTEMIDGITQRITKAMSTVAAAAMTITAHAVVDSRMSVPQTTNHPREHKRKQEVSPEEHGRHPHPHFDGGTSILSRGAAPIGIAERSGGVEDTVTEVAARCSPARVSDNIPGKRIDAGDRCRVYDATEPSRTVASPRERRKGLLNRPAILLLLVILVGIRFVAATVTAFAGIEGIGTRGLDTVFEIYSDMLLVTLFFVAAVGLSAWEPSLLARRGFLLFLGLSGATLVLWVGVVNPDLRILAGSFAAGSDFLLGAAASLALAVAVWILGDRVSEAGSSPVAADGFRSFGWGFTTALFLRSIRLLDFAYLFGWTPPPGLLWTLDFGPSLLLAAIAVVWWIRLVLVPRSGLQDHGLGLAVPVVSAAIAWAAASGVLGGFIVSNALAWGGSYTVFAPTALSLPVVGFGVGAFVSTAWHVGGRMLRPARWLIFGGVAIAALAGIQTSAGTLGSFAGLLAGIVCSALGLAEFVILSR